MEGDRLKHTARITTEGLKRVKTQGVSNELQQRIQGSLTQEESAESAFIIAAKYVTETFGRQAEGLRTLRTLNDNEERNRRSLQLLLRRKEVLNSMKAAFETESFTQLEHEQLTLLFDFGSAFINQISKEMGLFNVQYGLSGMTGAVLSNVTTAEMQQNLAELLISRAREASDVTSAEQSRASSRFLEERIFPLFHTMCVRAMGLQQGTHLYNVIENGVYGLAGAYLTYSDASLNTFGKSFRVIFPSPYLDALEQTDLLLIDEEGLSSEVRQEIMNAINVDSGSDSSAINGLSPQAKKHVYKVQVKARFNGPKNLTKDEVEERERFYSARCHSKGFDKADYLVLNSNRAREIVEMARGEI